MKNSKNGNKAVQGLLGFIILIGAILGLVAFILHFTDKKNCSEGYKSDSGCQSCLDCLDEGFGRACLPLCGNCGSDCTQCIESGGGKACRSKCDPTIDTCKLTTCKDFGGCKHGTCVGASCICDTNYWGACCQNVGVPGESGSGNCIAPEQQGCHAGSLGEDGLSCCQADGKPDTGSASEEWCCQRGVSNYCIQNPSPGTTYSGCINT